jgi:hypothetical protein
MVPQQYVHPVPVDPSTVAPVVQTPLQVADAPVSDTVVGNPKKGVCCWKCAVNTHASKDYKVVHYCLACDSAAHPTIWCPILNLPKPMGYFVGCGDDATLNLQLPDSVRKPHLVPSGDPIALVQVNGETVLPKRFGGTYVSWSC